MISVHHTRSADQEVRGYVCVGTSWRDYAALTKGSYWVNLMDGQTTCLKQCDVPWVSFDGINLGLCRMPKGHDGRCCDEVRVCDGCDTVYRADDEEVSWASNEDV